MNFNMQNGAAGQTPENNPADINQELENQIQGSQNDTGNPQESGQAEGNNQPAQDNSDNQDKQDKALADLLDKKEGSSQEPKAGEPAPEDLNKIVQETVQKTLQQNQEIERKIQEAAEKYGETFDEKEARALISKGVEPDVAIYATIGYKTAQSQNSQGNLGVSNRVPSSATSFKSPSNMDNEELEQEAAKELSDLMNQA